MAGVNSAFSSSFSYIIRLLLRKHVHNCRSEAEAYLVLPNWKAQWRALVSSAGAFEEPKKRRLSWRVIVGKRCGELAGHYFLSESSSSEELKLLVGGQPDNGERFGALAWWWPLQFRRELEFLVDGQTDNGERFWSTRLVVFGLNFRRR
ncbi:hypothetical protein B0H14DRAFT_2648795 [Mycena olivaceomarginata]|nr:hypothetical protein B0H14DRAFT_2648795 [Mycena olivaceomarginata]